ncbi:endonuclease/exonuclease/phosphatase family protein [Sphingomonas sabuli]|uniref:Endonuclease/exonuclease/phosphatase family protein n=1 Tax=Sphingomonas sabuli TaxID=2764186 RepID=A0A7G9L2D2_9SPHN|nr:endonuclease/exonuclease/phosphatase family protein [Sphingomonas sabuli]QNM82781.1 endonuclease/exonuclease/phosphatase family protein [Sphingomonas sabuli]
MACVQSRFLRAALSLLSLALIAAAPPARQCAPLRVMAFNIRLDLESDGINRWSERRDQVVGHIALARPDILGLQEVVPGQKADLERAFPDHAFIGQPRDDGVSKGEYSALMVDRRTFDVGDSGTFWLSPTPAAPSRGWDAAYSRVATWAHLVRRAGGHRILAINTHLDNEGANARREGARMIAQFAAKHRLPGERIVVTGDFNAEPGSPPVQLLAGPPLMLRDSYAAAARRVGPDETFTGFDRKPGDARRIDYVLADPALAVDSHAVLAWTGQQGRAASDHFAVVADLGDCR